MIKNTEALNLINEHKINQSYYYVGTQFHLIESDNESMAAFEIWYHKRSSVKGINKKLLTLHIIGGGGFLWNALRTMDFAYQNNIAIIVHEAYSAGCIYAIHKNADISKLKSARYHSVRADNYSSVADKLMLNLDFIDQLAIYREMFDQHRYNELLKVHIEHFTTRKAFCKRNKHSVTPDNCWITINFKQTV